MEVFMKKRGYKMAALLVCLAFLVSMAPALNSAPQAPLKSLKQLSLMSSFRMLSFLFPLLGTFTDLSPDNGKFVEKVSNQNSSAMIAKSTDDQIANQPKTKD